jgi:hemerythrin-like domain-containing protein
MEPTADLRFYLQIHAKLRADTARYVAAVDHVTEGDRPRRAALRRWARGFADELLEHHHAEDEHLFPSLAARVPASRPVLARLDADHRVLDDVLERWLAAARDIDARHGSFEAARDRLLATSTQLRDHIAEHLDIEDADIIPLFVRHYSAAEYDRVQARAAADARKQGVAFYVPWIVDALEGDVRERVIAEAPLAMRLLWRATRRPHAKLVATTFAGVPEPATHAT